MYSTWCWSGVYISLVMEAQIMQIDYRDIFRRFPKLHRLLPDEEKAEFEKFIRDKVGWDSGIRHCLLILYRLYFVYASYMICEISAVIYSTPYQICSGLGGVFIVVIVAVIIESYDMITYIHQRYFTGTGATIWHTTVCIISGRIVQDVLLDK